MYKFRLLVIFAAAVLIILPGCHNQDQTETYSFTATILEISETALLVEPAEGSAELSSSDKISVSVKDAVLLDSDNNSISIDAIKIGNQAEIFYSGGIAESYPAQVFGCELIRVLK